jgi:hypothetical protein
MNGDDGRGNGVIPRYALAPRCPGGMSANMAPGCDDAETGPRAVLAMTAAAPQQPGCSRPGPAQDHDQFARHEGVTEGDEQYRRT